MRNINDLLEPEHLKDLRKSGLSDETILSAKIKSISKEELRKALGYKPKYMKSTYRMPYPGIDFCRYKMFYHKWVEDMKLPKYLQAKGSGNHLYLPETIHDDLKDPEIRLYITEGEKKALKACQEGLCCIALSGLWSWSDGKKNLIPDFERIELKGRKVVIVPDTDWLSPNRHNYGKNLERPVYELSYRLMLRGASVHLVDLSGGGAQ